MSRIAAVLLLAAGFLCSAAWGQSTPPAPQSSPVPAPAPPAAAATACLPAKTLDDLTKALDEAISGPADKDRTCMRSLFFADSRLIPVGKTRQGYFAPHVLTIDNWIDAVKKRGNASFYEHQVKIKSETFGHIAHLWSTYEIRPTADAKAALRGINSIQAVFDGSRWKISQIVWETETPADPIPEKYLP
jgi:hypothetical protein